MDLLKKTFDVIPCVLMVVDAEMRLFLGNSAALNMMAGGGRSGERIGDLIQCVNSSESPTGCGGSSQCSSCVIKSSVDRAFRDKAAQRRRMVIKYLKDGPVTLPALVTAAPFGYGGKRLCLVVIEDVGELMQLRSLLPICFGCKKIRTEQNYWQNVEQYIQQHMADVEFTHGICAECAARLYPGEPPPAGVEADKPK
ncbi:MAG TPA: hypothetical protein DCZ93_05560 [Elusimicrobia bacterium]|nr:MAG: hypothetical protein A2X35_07145 [Elusimicrobia bacterium GWA2_61_42]OGR74988.1 MAG: hypothetical protein A2X38_01295 [Elusimicrobia bacterium GWC2_61_25]HBB66758.1 hypothetical protein [Elusimicrobiota bacterium]